MKSFAPLCQYERARLQLLAVSAEPRLPCRKMKQGGVARPGKGVTSMCSGGSGVLVAVRVGVYVGVTVNVGVIVHVAVGVHVAVSVGGAGVAVHVAVAVMLAV